MCVDTHVPSCARQRLSLSVWDVLLGFGISVLFCHAEIDHVDDIGSFRIWPSNQEVIWFDVSINQILLVNCLHSRQLGLCQLGAGIFAGNTNHLLRNHHNCFD